MSIQIKELWFKQKKLVHVGKDLFLVEITTTLFQVDWFTKIYVPLDFQIENWVGVPPPIWNITKGMLFLFIKDIRTVLCVDRLTKRNTVILFLKKLLTENLSNHHNQEYNNNTI